MESIVGIKSSVNRICEFEYMQNLLCGCFRTVYDRRVQFGTTNKSTETINFEQWDVSDFFAFLEIGILEWNKAGGTDCVLYFWMW